MTDVLTLSSPRSDVSVRRTGPSLPAFVGVEMRKSLSTRSGKLLAAASVVISPAVAGFAVVAKGEAFGPATGPLALMGLVTAYLLISLGVLSMAGEWSHRTVQSTYLLVPHRGRVLAAKALAVALLGAALAAVSTALTSGVLATMADGVSWDGGPRATVVAVVAGAAFAVIGAGVGAALANTPGALTALYLVLLGVLPLLSPFAPEITEKLDPGQAVPNLVLGDEQTQSVVTLVVWVVVSVVAGWILTHRRAVS
jgi:ABC-2 type transport system permease protein